MAAATHRLAVVALAATCGGALGTGPGPGAAVATLRGRPMTAAADVEAVIAAAATLCAWAAVAWLALGVVVVLLGRLPGAVGHLARVMARAVLPRVLRRSLEAVLGAALVVSPTATTAAAASTTPTPPPAPPAQSALSDPPGPLERPATPPSPAPPSTTTPPARELIVEVPVVRPAAPAVVVAPGDTLWAIAARRLPAGATAADVDRAWRSWYRANSSVVGADPDLIHPGQRLRPPAR